MRRLIRSAIPSMFHRRLVLQLAVFGVAIGALVGRLGILTLAEGGERLEQAESRLVRTTWTPTVRGRILDRTGRILAMDRPSYTAAVRFDVLSGAWAERGAASAARRVFGERWDAADEGERAVMLKPFLDRYSAHVDRMLDRLSEMTGVERAVLDRRAERTLAVVARTKEAVVIARENRLVRQHLSSGRGLSDADEARLAEAAVTRIAEEERAHALVSDLADEAAFALRRLETRRVPLFTEAELARAVGEAGASGGAVSDGAAEALYVDLFPGLVIEDSTDRVRPFDEIDVRIDRSTLPGPMRGEGYETVRVTGVGWHTLGTLRGRIYGEDHERRREAVRALPDASSWLTASGVDRGRYLEGDAVGSAGVERANENRLRGLRGLRRVRLDTGTVESHEPEAGHDVHLTIDAMLEARIRAVLEPGVGLTTVQPWHGNDGVPVGETLAGAVVVIGVDTGDVLACVSTPVPSGSERWSGDGDEEYPAFLDPTVNRAISVPYPPGSIVKPLVLSAAVARGYHRLGSGIVCTGHLLENRNDVYRCWIYKQYGATHSPTGEPVRAAESVKFSCNLFYYTLGRRLGVDELRGIYGDLGVGAGFDLGVAGGIGRSWPGKVGTVGTERELGMSDAIMMAMGQGPVTWTPMHAANSFAVLARGGAWIEPRIVDDGSVPIAERMMNLDPAAVGESLRGLKMAVDDANGTGSTIGFADGRERIFNVPGVDVWGKTGTAQAPSLRYDPDGDGPEEARVVRSSEHAWFNVLAGPEGEGPRYAVSVLIEYGGGGGRVAGPVANQVLHALSAEGYLP